MVTGICVLMFITESTNNESAYFVQNLSHPETPTVSPTGRHTRKSVRVSRSSQYESIQTTQVTQSESSSRRLLIQSFGWSCWFDSVKVGSDPSPHLLRPTSLPLSDWQSESEQGPGNIHTQRRYYCMWLNEAVGEKYNHNPTNHGVILIQPPLLS